MACASLKIGGVSLATLDRGSDLLSEIERLVRENDIDFCEVTGIGSLERAQVTYYDQAEQEDREITFERPMMLIALAGTVLRQEPHFTRTATSCWETRRVPHSAGIYRQGTSSSPAS